MKTEKKINIEHPNKIAKAAESIINLRDAGIISQRQARNLAKKAVQSVNAAMEYWGGLNEAWLDKLNETYRKLAKI